MSAATFIEDLKSYLGRASILGNPVNAKIAVFSRILRYAKRVFPARRSRAADPRHAHSRLPHTAQQSVRRPDGGRDRPAVPPALQAHGRRLRRIGNGRVER